MTQKSDLRVRRSRKLIQDALIELTVEKQGFADITVRDITERAMVNRSTFYRHFLDKYDLIQQFMDDIYELTGVDEKIIIPATDHQPEYKLPLGLLNLLRHVQEYADFYRIMLGANGDPAFAERFRQNSEKRRMSIASSQNPQNPVPLDMRLKYVSYAAIGAIVWWLDNGQPCRVEELANWISQLSFPLWSDALPSEHKTAGN